MTPVHISTIASQSLASSSGPSLALGEGAIILSRHERCRCGRRKRNETSIFAIPLLLRRAYPRTPDAIRFRSCSLLRVEGRALSNWHNASKKEPCPICQKTDWCSLSNDGILCVCKRVPSPYPTKSGNGWIHVLKDAPREERVYKPLPKRRLFDAEKTMENFRKEFLFSNLLPVLAKDIDLLSTSVDKFECGFSSFHSAWAFPMRDGDEKVVGIRLRQKGSSKKWSVAGSQDGLFISRGLTPREAVYNGLKGKELFIVEGATDAIAGLSLGLPCVGRSSCNTGGEHLLRLCERLRVSRVTIIADNDSYKTREDGSLWKPGLEGAKKLAQKLKRVYRIIIPPKKDLREWVQCGATQAMILKICDLQKWQLIER